MESDSRGIKKLYFNRWNLSQIDAPLEAVPEAPEIELLRRFRRELDATLLQIEVLTATRDALLSVVIGLEDTLELKGIKLRPNKAKQQSLLTSPPLVASAVAVLRNEKVPMGVREIHVAMRHRGFVVNYSTLYKALQRESEREPAAIIRRRGKYELSDSASAAAATER